MSYHFPLLLLSMLLLFFTSAIARAQGVDVLVESGERKVAVLELYTSEGCSSCPPADAFVSRLADAGHYPQQVIPLGFHVTYWNYIGWRDPYSHKRFDERQREVAERSNSRTVYTPQLVLDGRDLRGAGRFEKRLESLNTEKAQAHIRLRAQAEQAGDPLALEVTVEVADAALGERPELYVVLFENALSNQVDAGENRGKMLHHDFVVRELLGPLPLSSARGPGQHRLRLSLPEALVPENAGLAAFVQNRDDGRVLQAVATPLRGVR